MPFFWTNIRNVETQQEVVRKSQSKGFRWKEILFSLSSEKAKKSFLQLLLWDSFFFDQSVCWFLQHLAKLIESQFRSKSFKLFKNYIIHQLARKWTIQIICDTLLSITWTSPLMWHLFLKITVIRHIGFELWNVLEKSVF